MNRIMEEDIKTKVNRDNTKIIVCGRDRADRKGITFKNEIRKTRLPEE